MPYNDARAYYPGQAPTGRPPLGLARLPQRLGQGFDERRGLSALLAAQAQALRNRFRQLASAPGGLPRPGGSPGGPRLGGGLGGPRPGLGGQPRPQLGQGRPSPIAPQYAAPSPSQAAQVPGGLSQQLAAPPQFGGAPAQFGAPAPVPSVGPATPIFNEGYLDPNSLKDFLFWLQSGGVGAGAAAPSSGAAPSGGFGGSGLAGATAGKDIGAGGDAYA